MADHTLEGADKIRRVSSGVLVGRTTAGEGRAELLTPGAVRGLLAVQTAGEVAALYYNKTEVDSLLTAKANASHGHIIADVTGLSTTLNGIQSDIVTLATTSVPKTTTLTINGTAQDLTANRSWTVGDLRSDGTYNNPAWLNQLAWSKITGITGVPNGSKYLRDDGSWQTLDLSPYLTTAAAALAYVPFTGATAAVNLGTQSLSAGAITASGTVIAATKILFSGTTSTECGVINATGTRLIWGRNSTSAALMTQSLNENAGGSGFTFRRGEGLSWSGSTSSSEGGGQTAYIFSEAANTYNFRNGLSAQSLELENTYTSSTTREFLRLRGVAGANFEIGPSNGSIGGTLRGLTIGGFGNGSSTITPWLTFDNTGAATFAAGIYQTNQQWMFWGGTAIFRGDAGVGLQLNNTAVRNITQLEFGSNNDAVVVRDSADTLTLRRTTNAATFNVSNTWTSSTNFEFGRLSWATNEFRIGTAVGGTGGAQRNTVIGTWNTAGGWTPAVTVASTGTTTFGNTIYVSAFSGMVMGNDVTFARDTASTLELRNSTTAITFALSNTYSSSTNFEHGRFQWTTNEWRIGTAVGSVGGSVRETVFGSTTAAGTWTPSLRILASSSAIAGPKTTAWTISSGTQDQGASTLAGNDLTIQASSAVAGSSVNGAAAGGSVFIYAGSGTRLNAGTASGGSITIKAGAPSIGGTPGTVNITGADGTVQSNAGDVYIRGGTATQTNNNLSHGSIYLITTGLDNYFIPGIISMSTGYGSRNTNAGGTGGAGAAYTFTSGYGGASDLGGGTKTGGNGGAFTYTTGYGGAASSGTTNIGGNGGAYSITTGNGGAATGTAATGGNGGAINLTAGNGGAGAVTNGNGGSITLTAGAAGGGAGTAGVAGTLAFNGASVFTSQSAAAIPVRINGAASQSGNLLELRDSGGSIGFMVTSGWVVTANRSGGSPNGSFAASETSSGYAFQGGWGGMRANSGTAATGNLLQSPYGWTLSCGSGYGVDIVNSTNAQTLRLFNTFTSTTVNEFLKLAWNASVAEIGTVKGGSGGSARDLVLQTDGTTRMTFGAAGTATVNTTLVTSTTALINSGSQAFNSSFHLVSWNGGCLGWASTGTVTTSSSLDTALKRVSAGLIEINNGTAGAYRDLILRNLRMSAPAVPATATSTGSEGQVSWDSNYVYVCVATDSWKRAALSSW